MYVAADRPLRARSGRVLRAPACAVDPVAAPRPDVYKRHYVVRERPVNVDGAHGEFDVMTELGWESEADYQRWAEAVAASARTIAEDEARFLTRARTRSVVTREFPVGG